MEQSYTSGADYSGINARIAIVSARFNGHIVEAMRAAAHTTLLENGVSENNISSVHVPGAFELPIVCKTIAVSNEYHGIIALGCVIRGDTPHFDYVCQGCNKDSIRKIWSPYDGQDALNFLQSQKRTQK